MQVPKKSSHSCARLGEAFRKYFKEITEPFYSLLEKGKKLLGIGKKEDFGDLKIDPDMPLTIPPELDLKGQPDTLAPPKGEPQAPLYNRKYIGASTLG